VHTQSPYLYLHICSLRRHCEPVSRTTTQYIECCECGYEYLLGFTQKYRVQNNSGYYKFTHLIQISSGLHLTPITGISRPSAPLNDLDPKIFYGDTLLRTTKKRDFLTVCPEAESFFRQHTNATRCLVYKMLTHDYRYDPSYLACPEFIARQISLCWKEPSRLLANACFFYSLMASSCTLLVAVATCRSWCISTSRGSRLFYEQTGFSTTRTFSLQQHISPLSLSGQQRTGYFYCPLTISSI
jgi:hypothetical protein